MTDNEQELESDQPMHEDGETHAEGWQEELPPEDDFHDRDEHEPDATISEEVETAAETFTPPESREKRGSKVLFGTLAGIALVIGGLAYLQFGGKSAPKAPAPVPASVTTKSAPSSAPENALKAQQSDTGFSSLPATPTTSEADITAIYNAGIGNTKQPMTNTVAIPGDSSPDNSLEKGRDTRISASDILTTAPIVPPVKPMATPEKTPVLETPPPVAAPAPVAVAPVLPSAAQTEMENRIKELSSQLEDLKNTIGQMNLQTSQIVSKLEKAPSEDAMKSLEALENRLAQLEQKLAQSGNKKSIKPVAKEEVKEPVKELSALPQELENVHFPPSMQEEAPVKQTVKKATASRLKKAVKARDTSASKAKAAGWVLRAATPDSAWVSKGANAPELQQVQVGDTLPGIGKIRAIEQTGDRWTIIGTQGKIH